MKKKWLSVVALCMCFSMGVSAFAGCGDKGDDSVNSGSLINSEQGGGNGGGNNSTDGGNGGNENNGGNQGGNGGGQTMSKDAIYAAVMDAMDATNAYKGSFTANISMEDSNSTNTVTMSVDATNKFYYYVNESKGSYEGEEYSYKSVDKMFKVDDTYYTYSDGYGETEYYKLTADQVDDELDNSSMAGISSTIDGMPTEIESVDALNAAFAEVFADSKAAQAAAGSNADGSCVFTCTEDDGVLSAAMAMSIAMDIPEMGAMSIVMNMKLVAEGGYITEMYVKQIMSMTMGDETMEQGMEMDCDISYVFNQAGYDAIEVTLPDEVEDKESNSYYSSQDFETVINGVNAKEEYFYGEDVESAITSFMTEDWRHEGMNVTWYTDAACTKALTANMTAAEVEAITTLYGQATLKDGYAFVITNEKTVYADDVTDAYKLVFETLGMIEAGESKYIEAVMGSFGVEEQDGGVIVNGEAVEFGAEDNGYKYITITAGETYTVEYTKTYAKADLNIFALLMSEM